MKKFNPREGHYWVAQTPDQRWAVLWSHSNHPNWHYMVASFAEQDRATDYALVENDCIDFGTEEDGNLNPVPVGQLPPPPPPYGEARLPSTEPTSVSYPWRETVARDLEKLFSEFPEGFGVHVIQERYGMTYLSATDLMRWAHDQKLALWVYENGHSGRKVCRRPNSPIPIDPLSKKQRQVLEALERLSDQHGIVSETNTRLAREAGLSANGFGSILYALECRKFLMLAKPSHDGRPATYQILKRSVEAPAISQEAVQ